MLQDSTSLFEADPQPICGTVLAAEASNAWKSVDRTLRSIACRRAALDAEEAHWLREAERLRIWRPLGMVSVLDYLERVLGYAPRTAQDRLRVARALGTLPQLTSALASGALSFSAIRELTRVVTPETESVWCKAAAGKNLRQIEELVADHRHGDSPDDPPDPQARTHVVQLELAAETFALLRQARQLLDDERGTNLADDDFIAALCEAVLDAAPTTEPAGRAKFQIAVTVCRRCGRGTQEGAGVQVPIDDAAVDRAMCDAQHIGSIDGEAPARAHQDIPPSIARLVWRRDGNRCRVPGCRSARGLELHHLVRRADGGGHEASNIVLICSACHAAHHRGALTILGTAAHLEVRRSEQDMSGPVRDRETAAHVDTLRRPSAGVEASADVVIKAPVNERVSAPPAASEPVRSVGNNATGEVFHQTGKAGGTRAHVGADRELDAAIRGDQAKRALIQLGWKPAIARAAVEEAVTISGADTPLDQLIVAALRCCPRPTSVCSYRPVRGT